MKCANETVTIELKNGMKPSCFPHLLPLSLLPEEAEVGYPFLVFLGVLETEESTFCFDYH